MNRCWLLCLPTKLKSSNSKWRMPLTLPSTLISLVQHPVARYSARLRCGPYNYPPLSGVTSSATRYWVLLNRGTLSIRTSCAWWRRHAALVNLWKPISREPKGEPCHLQRHPTPSVIIVRPRRGSNSGSLSGIRHLQVRAF